MKRFFKFLFIKLPLAFIGLSLLLVVATKWLPVLVTPLMVKRSIEYKEDKDFHTRKRWVSLEKISPAMGKAVIASEDNRFMEHNGFDTKEIRKMLEDHKEKGKRIRGCSTISQQTAKNVFTLCSDTWFRKAYEAYFTVLIELIWGKERILEVYLNVAETGKGLYGVEAASRKYFDKKSSELTIYEAASLAACLPNPITRTPKSIPTSRRNAIVKITSQLEYPEWLQ